MGDIFREIDEELRQERFEGLWKAYGRYAIGIGLAVVLSVVGWQVWDYYRTGQRHAESLQYATAERLLDQERSENAAALFANLADRAGGGYQYLARFHQAALRAEAGDVSGAVGIYDSLAADSGLNRAMRDAAVIFAVTLRVDEASADAAALRARLDPLMNGGSSWRHSARELAGLLFLKQGDPKAAQEHFRTIADDLEAPQGMRARAAQVLAVIDG